MHRGSICYYKHVTVKDHPVEDPTVISHMYLQQPNKNYTNQIDLPKNKSKICREFWLHGHCKIGNYCSFNHVKSSSDNHNKINQDSSKKTPCYQPAISDHQTQQVKQICLQYKFGRCKDYQYCEEKYDHLRRCRDMLTFSECKQGREVQGHFSNVRFEPPESLPNKLKSGLTKKKIIFFAIPSVVPPKTAPKTENWSKVIFWDIS